MGGIVLVFGLRVKHVFANESSPQALTSNGRSWLCSVEHMFTGPVCAGLVHEERLAMAAVTIQVQSPPAYVATAPTAVTSRRRRLTALLAAALIALAVVAVALRAAAAFGAPPASPLDRRPVPPASVVAHPGDTMWSVARRVQPTGDVRPLVDALVRLNGGAALDVGDVVLLP
jgi:hypothetical protein